MDWLTWILFESRAALGALLFVALFVLLVLWRRGGSGRALLIGVVAAAALLAVQTLVVTRREHAGRILDAVERDLVGSRTDALAVALDPDFRCDGLDRAAFLALVQRQLANMRIYWVQRLTLRVRPVTSDRFVAVADYWAEVAVAGLRHTPRSAWSLTLSRGRQGWKIVDIRCLHINGSAVPEWVRIDRRP